MLFKDRKDAGIKLATELEKFAGEDAVVFALPRGGVVLGVEIANRLHAPLDLVFTKKVGHPHNPEYAICAVSEEGDPICNALEVRAVDPDWFAKELKQIRQEITRRREEYFGDAKLRDIEGKVVILVDDGIATGFTMFAAIEELRRRNPKRIVVAIPITPYDTAQTLMTKADELVSLDIDTHYLGSVGAYYQNFAQVQDNEVISLLLTVENKE